MNSNKDLNFWFALMVILVAIFLLVAVYFDWLGVSFFVGPLRFGHWLGVLGTLFIAFFTPAYYILKRRYPKRLKAMLNVHIFGNLFSFMLISVHFAQQISRPPQFYPDLGTGVILYIAMLILVSTGFLHRFKLLEGRRIYPPHRNRFLHLSITLTFYLVIVFHALRNLGLI
ncbi:MAG: hypothetical protein OEZ18_05645 [Candidatus Bathyarchaeota archaeon]|nr:hypothetical protein [Candidatus Bathyarchaeota archaeon]